MGKLIRGNFGEDRQRPEEPEPEKTGTEHRGINIDQIRQMLLDKLSSAGKYRKLVEFLNFNQITKTDEVNTITVESWPEEELRELLNSSTERDWALHPKLYLAMLNRVNKIDSLRE
jgi:hypothetical protein